MSFFGPPIRNGVPIGLGSSIGFGSAPFTPAELFYAGEQGFWYDPTDIPLAWRRNLGVMTTFGSLAGSAGAQYPNGTGWSNFFNTGGTRTYVASSVNPGEFAMDLSGVSNARNLIGFTFTPTSGTTYTVSFWIESVSGVTGTISYVTGTLGTGGTTNSIVAPTTTGRVSYTFTTGTGSGAVDVRLGIGAAGNESGSIRVSGFQVEVGSTASTYQQIVTPEISFLQYQSQPVLYTDSAGTTPVTAVEQAVGLMLDKSKGATAGPNVVINGNFTTDSDWTKGTGWTITGGAAQGTTIGGLLTQSGVLVSGTWYKATVVISAWTGSYSLTVGFNATSNFIITAYAAGTYTGYFVAPSNDLVLRVNTGGGVAGTISVDSLVVQAIPGNHAFQTTSAKRPVLRARYNLLTYSEQFDNGVWTKLNSTISAIKVTDPLGGTTAQQMFETTANAAHVVYQDVISTSGTSFTFSFYAKGNQRNWCALQIESGATYAFIYIDLSTNTIGTSGGDGTTTISATSATAGNGFSRITATVIFAASKTSVRAYIFAATGNGTASYAGDITKGLIIWGADLRPASQATGLIGPTYQRIAAATDYDVVGFLPYLQFDGVDDALTTNSIDFTTTDKMTVFAGVRKLSDPATGQVIAEFTTVSTDPGAFSLFGGSATATRLFAWSVASPQAFIGTATFAAPTTVVNTLSIDRAGTTTATQLFPRLNGAAATQSEVIEADATGNFANAALFIGARNQTSVYFNGWLTSLIGRGAATTAGQISATEQWVNTKTGAY